MSIQWTVRHLWGYPLLYNLRCQTQGKESPRIYPPPPPLRVKKKLRVKGEGVVKNWFAAFSESNVGPRVSEVHAMNSCLLNNEWWLLRPTVRILSILRLKMTLLSLGLKEKNSRWTFSRRMVKICQFSCLTANFWPFYDQQLIPLKFLRIFA